MIDFLISGALLLFVLFALLPLLFFKFLVTQCLQSIWYGILSILYPEVEFVKNITVRSLLDTQRNQGIGAVLLCVKGPADAEAVRRHLREVVNRRSKNGNLTFPRLRDALVTRCGTYAWQKVKFELDKNVTVVSGTYKKRPINEFNIQEYVSDLMTKYLPQNTSPWHVIIIPTLEDHHYILLKLHHILLNEQLNIGDLLPLLPPTKHNTGTFSCKSPLINVYKKPKSIPQLKERLTEDLSNRWNEFLSNYDPLERTELLKTNPTFLQFLAICLITSISILKELRRGFRVIKTDMSSRFQFISYTIRRERKKRKVNFDMFLLSIFASLDPRNVIKTYFEIVWGAFTWFTIGFPSFFLSEFLAFYQCFIQGYCNNPNTFVGIIYTYVPLTLSAFKELVDILKSILYAPKNIISRILCQKEYLQTITLSGRKCLAWSEPIKTNDLKLISQALGVSELEILLTGLSVNFSKYLKNVDHVIPDEIAITIRNINSNYVFATGVNVRPEDACSGILFMGLPIINEIKGDTAIENLIKIRKTLQESTDKQQVSFLLTILQTRFGFLTKILPATVLAIYLRYLSRKFAVALTEISSRYPNVRQRTIWGQEVTSVIYWRPPQANTCVSLCLNEYEDHVKLGVMCDAQLVPNHILLVKHFSKHIEQIGKAAGVQKSSTLL